MHNLTKSKMADRLLLSIHIFVTICDKTTYNTSFSGMKYLVSRDYLSISKQQKKLEVSEMQGSGTVNPTIYNGHRPIT